ncbi:MAG: 2-oxo acid dehydrogenase subunit E2, partial [Terriglobia bacterium]
MESKSGPQQGINAWLEEELLQQYRQDRGSVDPEWTTVFEHDGSNGVSNAPGNGAARVVAANGSTPASAVLTRAVAEPAILDTDELMPLRGAAGKIAENMAASVTIPLATSQRIIPVKVIDENRRLINHHRGLAGKSKVSYTHLIGWAIVRSVQANPGLNNSFTWNAAGEPFRVLKKEINFGLAVDVAGKNGARSLVVPNIKNAGAMSFTDYMAAFDALVAKARTNKLAMPDFQGTTISLTNPGTVGTMSSIPRLMVGQGAIIAVGAM